MLNCVWATHGLPADRAPVAAPTGVPTDTQAGWYQGQSANPLAALLLQLLRLLQLLHACARDQHTLDKLSQTHSLGQMYVDVDFDRFGLYCDAPHISNLNL